MDMNYDLNDQYKSNTYIESLERDTLKLLQHEKTKQNALSAMKELEGWCTPFKASVLMDLVFQKNAQTIVEIGVWGGKSLVPMAFALKDQGEGVVYGIDPWSRECSADGMTGENYDWWTAVDHESIYQGLVKKIQKFNLGEYVELLRCTSEGAPTIVDIDILHIDGNHSDETSFYDVCKWVPLVKSGGLIVFDDTTWGTTTRAVEWLDLHCTKIVDYHESNDWGIWLKK